MSIDVNHTQEALLDKLKTPSLLLNGEQVTYANEAALALLGRHIMGANARLALRAPAAISAVFAPQDSRALVQGLGTPDSMWELNSQKLAEGRRLVTMRDISAQRSVARVHADFVANASHELRTPIANILGYVETLEANRAGGDAATRERFLGTIKREAQRMQSVISDLMSLSRIEAEKHSLPDTEVDCVTLCKAIVAEFEGNDDVTLKIAEDLADNGQAIIKGDEAQLKQMLRNLVDNAVKYGNDKQVSLSLEINHRGWAVLTVEDQGEGIPPEHIPRLTERFYRIDAGRSKEAGGTGLGLSIVKHIVVRHRGRLNIDSRIGQGSSFNIMLPLVLP